MEMENKTAEMEAKSEVMQDINTVRFMRRYSKADIVSFIITIAGLVTTAYIPNPYAKGICIAVAALAIFLGIKIGRRTDINQKKDDAMAQTDTAKIAQRVLNLIILDESGSMHSIKTAAVNGMNETLHLFLIV